MTDIIFIILLLIPTAYAVYNDRDGDVHPNNDWVQIGVVMLVCCLVVSFVDTHLNMLANLLRTFLMSFGLYCLLFNWAVVIMLVNRGKIELPKGKKWYQHFSKNTWPDNWFFWNQLSWWKRLLIQLWIFGVCASVYFCPCKIVSFYNECFICK